MYPESDEQKTESPEQKEIPDSKNSNNWFFWTLAAAAVGVLVYFTIKEGDRIKKENELLDYEVW